jgi:hypothetical protein
MKKIASIFMLAFLLIATVIPTNAGNCPSGTAGVCVAIYGPDGTISSYTCSTGATSAPKDCATGSSDESL